MSTWSSTPRLIVPTRSVGAIIDIGGNKLRLIAVVDYQFKKVFIRAVLDHREYDRNYWT